MNKGDFLNEYYSTQSSSAAPQILHLSEDAGTESSSQIRSPRLGDIVDSGIGLSYRAASLYSLEGRYENPVPELTLSHQSWTKNLTTGLLRLWHGQNIY
jgi:hypothetical protein